MSNVLDLPIERQRELATLFGMELDEWQKHIKETTESIREYNAILDSNPPFEVSSSEREQQVRERYDSERPEFLDY